MFDVLIKTMGPLAWRSIWRNKRRTLITMMAIVFGLVLALSFLTLGNGVYRKVINDAARMYGGHFTIEHTDYRSAPAIDLTIQADPKLRKKIEALKGVISTRAIVTGQGMARSGRGATGVAIMGIEAELEKETSPLADKIISGKYLSTSSKRKVVIGEKLATRLKVKVGKKLVLAANSSSGEFTEELFRVEGIFKTGSPEADGYLVQIPIEDARKFYALGKDRATSVAILAEDAADFDDALETTAKFIDKDAVVLRWSEILTAVASFIQIDRTSNLTINSIIVFMGLFTIWNTILMSVLERKREFAVMLALGTNPRLIRLQILGECIWIGLIGCCLGIGIAWCIGHWLETTGLDLRAVMDLKEGTEQTVAGFAVPMQVYGKIWWDMYIIFGGGIMAFTLIMSAFATSGIKKIDVANVLR